MTNVGNGSDPYGIRALIEARCDGLEARIDDLRQENNRRHQENLERFVQQARDSSSTRDRLIQVEAREATVANDMGHLRKSLHALRDAMQPLVSLPSIVGELGRQCADMGKRLADLGKSGSWTKDSLTLERAKIFIVVIGATAGLTWTFMQLLGFHK